MVTPKRLRLLFLAIALMSLAVYAASLALPRSDNHIIGSDGLYYYAYLPTALIDGDLDLSNQYARYNSDGAAKIDLAARTETGLLPNFTTIGSAVLWSPFFLAALGFSLAQRALGQAITIDGYGPLFEGMVGLGSVLYGLAGIWFIWRLARRFVDEEPAFISALGIWISTNVLYYMVVEPSMSHVLSMFAVALFLYYWHYSGPSRPTRQWATLGMLAGLMALIRPQDLFWGLIVVLDLYPLARASFTKVSASALSFSVAALAVFAPQMVVWRVLYGQWLVVPQGQGFMQWGSPHMLEVLFSSYHGLFLWHPFFLAGFLGLLAAPLFLKTRRADFVLLAALFLLQVYLNAVASDWWAGDSFGLRRFISSAPVLALGAAMLLNILKADRRHLWPALILVGILAGWNLLFMVQYRFGLIPMSAPLSFDQLVTDKFRLPWLLLERLRFAGAYLR